MPPVVDTPVLAVACAIWEIFYRKGRPASVRGPSLTRIQSVALILVYQGHEQVAGGERLAVRSRDEPRAKGLGIRKAHLLGGLLGRRGDARTGITGS